MVENLVYITAPSDGEAKDIARTLVKERLAACANVINGVTSFYWWQGTLEEDREYIIVAKTTEEHAEALIGRVKDLHSAVCPCIIFLPIEKGNPEFLRWIHAETGFSGK